MTRKWMGPLTLVSFLLPGAQPAASQDGTRLETAAGYSVLEDRKIGDFGLSSTLPAGWWLSVSVNLNRWFAISTEAGGNYGSDSTLIVRQMAECCFEAIDESVDVRAHAFLLGPRLRARGERITPFVQALAGFARLEVAGEWGETHWSYSELALQPGGGIDIKLSDRAAVRIQADYRAVLGEETYSQFRISAGVTLGFVDR